MSKQGIYKTLGEHLSRLGMGYPMREDLLEILRENFTPAEAEVCLAIPNRVIPLQPAGIDEILSRVKLSREELVRILENLSQKGLLFSGETKEGQKGYALQQVGFGFPQTFFWKGENTPYTQKMASLVSKYFDRDVTREAYHSVTKPYRYIPVGRTIDPTMQAVYPRQRMEDVIEKAEKIAVAHCPCRMAYALRGRGCSHPTEVCLKFNDLARYVIDRGFAREITRLEALKIIRLSEQSGLVHFVDNAEGEIQHNCNCCGCACWNVGNFKRRKIPRDVLMATYFIRDTEDDQCTGCGTCVDICPVDALTPGDHSPTVDLDWCIGCGVCAHVCPNEAAKLIVRPDGKGQQPAPDFWHLHETIRKEKG